jgi:hypothetical protein
MFLSWRTTVIGDNTPMARAGNLNGSLLHLIFKFINRSHTKSYPFKSLIALSEKLIGLNSMIT